MSRVKPSSFIVGSITMRQVWTSLFGGSTSTNSPSIDRLGQVRDAAPGGARAHVRAAADAQVVVGDAAVAVALGPLGLGDRVPDRLGRGPDVDAVDLGRRLGHGAHALSSWVLRSASAETRRSVYLSIQRSWIRRIGTGLR